MPWPTRGEEPLPGEGRRALPQSTSRNPSAGPLYCPRRSWHEAGEQPRLWRDSAEMLRSESPVLRSRAPGLKWEEAWGQDRVLSILELRTATGCAGVPPLRRCGAQALCCLRGEHSPRLRPLAGDACVQVLASGSGRRDLQVPLATSAQQRAFTKRGAGCVRPGWNVSLDKPLSRGKSRGSHLQTEIC